MPERTTLNRLHKAGRIKPRKTLYGLKRSATDWRKWYKLPFWVKGRREFLRENPLCVDPYGYHEGGVQAANTVDHKIPHKGDWDLFSDKSNWQSMCASCHNHKTATEDGGFGNFSKPEGLYAGEIHG